MDNVLENTSDGISDDEKAAYVSMKGVGHKYDPRPDAPMVVQDIDLDIHRHEFVA
ncbi:MAG: NitT/TauT family transport system ATP-binding protein, partial [Marinomonas primoryensis]